MSWKLSCRVEAPDWPLNGEAGGMGESRLHLNDDEKKGPSERRKEGNDEEERLV